jgi:hydroxymethylpyrimidine/phosphomethylpyrimidine kinase
MISKHGARLLDADALAALRNRLLPQAALVTPNAGEAALLAGITVENAEHMRTAARRIRDLGAKAVLVKGGHIAGAAVDIFFEGTSFSEFSAPRIHTRHTHGTGCAYSAAITAYLARGCDLYTAIGNAKSFITEAIASGPGLGAGHGPVNHWAESRDPL